MNKQLDLGELYSEWAVGSKQNELMDDATTLKETVKEFFEQYLDIWETSDNNVEFNPITIGCCRCMKIKGLNETIHKMRTLSGAKPRYNVNGWVDLEN